MQLHLETDELDLLANVLMERIGAMAAQAASAGSPKSGIGLAPDPQRYDDLLDKVLARDLKFDSDELEYVADLLTARSAASAMRLRASSAPVLKTELQKKLAVLERVLEQVDEALRHDLSRTPRLAESARGESAEVPLR